MGSTYGYTFYFKTDDEVLTFPITPGELNIKSGSNNEVVNLINEGDINILKSPSLTEVEFEAQFPMRQYPYGRKFTNFKEYFKVFKRLKEEKESFRFIVARTKPNGKSRTWDTNLLVSLEDMELNESTDNGDDVIISFKLKQYKDYGVVKIKTKTVSNTTKKVTTTSSNRSTSTVNTQQYTVKSGDCLWNIARKFYNDGTLWKKIYQANKTTIENTAKRYGYSSSSNGHWIFPGTKLTIPSK